MTKMKKMLEEAYKSELKLDRESVYRLCNSLNACSGPVRLAGLELAAFYMIRAEGTIFRLFDENQKLKEMLESRESINQ